MLYLPYQEFLNNQSAEVRQGKHLMDPMTLEELNQLEFLTDKFESYLFKKYNRTNGHQTTMEYAHTIISNERDEVEGIKK